MFLARELIDLFLEDLDEHHGLDYSCQYPDQPRIWREIQMAPPTVTNAVPAIKYGIHRHTVAKWCKRESAEDTSARPYLLGTTLSEAQEAVVVAIRELLLLPLDALLVIVREFIEPELSRLALDRCLRRHGVSNLKAMLHERAEEEGVSQPAKGFKAYEPGFVHIDVKYRNGPHRLDGDWTKISAFLQDERTAQEKSDEKKTTYPFSGIQGQGGLGGDPG